MRERFRVELRRLEKLNVIAPVDEPTEWVSQIVVAMKKSGALRVCIDPKPLNEALKRERYQIPVVDDLLPDLSEARVFSKVDLASAFWHLELDEESSKLTTFATPNGRFQWLRLPFGLNVSSEIFQKLLEGKILMFCIYFRVLRLLFIICRYNEDIIPFKAKQFIASCLK